MDPTINLVLQVNNPTPITAEIQKIYGVLYVEGQAVGNVLGITPTTLQSGSSSLNVPVTLSYDAVANLLLNLKGKKFSYNFVGTITIDYITIPLNFGYSY